MENKTINKQIRSTSNRSSLLLLLFFVIAVPFRTLLRFVYRYAEYGSVWQNEKLILLLGDIGLYIVVYPILFTVYYKRMNRKNGLRLKDTFQKSRRSKGWLLKWTVIAVGVSQLFSIIANNLIMLIFHIDLTNDSALVAVTGKDDVLGWLLYIVPTVLCAPVFEEILFRATIFRNNEPTGQLFAAVVTGIAFGLWHINPGQTVFASVFGVFLCLIYIKTRSIVSVMFIHFVNNLLHCALTFVKVQLGTILSAEDKMFMIEAMFDTQTVPAIALTLLILITIAALIAGVVLLIVELVKRKGKFGLGKGTLPYGVCKKSLIFFSAPLTIIAFVLMIVLTFAG